MYGSVFFATPPRSSNVSYSHEGVPPDMVSPLTSSRCVLVQLSHGPSPLNPFRIDYSLTNVSCVRKAVRRRF